jgi:hypothetical protein
MALLEIASITLATSSGDPPDVGDTAYFVVDVINRGVSDVEVSLTIDSVSPGWETFFNSNWGCQSFYGDAARPSNRDCPGSADPLCDCRSDNQALTIAAGAQATIAKWYGFLETIPDALTFQLTIHANNNEFSQSFEFVNGAHP